MAQHLPETASNNPELIRRVIVRLNQLFGSVGTSLNITPSVAQIPSAVGNVAPVVWVAMESGTQNGTPYSPGDLVYTIRVGTVTKTIVIGPFGGA